jgi:transposase
MRCRAPSRCPKHAIDDRPWGGPSPPAVACVFADGRGTDKIAGQFTGFADILQVDGYAAYKALARGHGGAIQLAFYLTHAPRKFVEVYKTMQSPFAREVIERLQAVYAIEAEIRGSSAEQRLTARRTRTAPLMAALKARLTAMVGQLFSQSKLTEAINYALNHWDGLTLFLRDGHCASAAKSSRRFELSEMTGGDRDRQGPKQCR